MFLIIAILAVIIVGLIFFLLGKIPLFRWIGGAIITIVKYTLLTIFNLLAIGVISGLATIGVALAFGLFHYLDWKFFMVGKEILFIIHDAFFIVSFLTSLCFVSSILLGSLIFSFIPLSTRKYVIASYAIGVTLFILVLPSILQLATPEVDATLLGMIVISMILPILGFIFAISTGQQRKERRREMTYEEIAREDAEEKRKNDFRKQAIFPWIRNRAR